MDSISFSATAFLNVGSGFWPETLLAWMNDEKVAVAFALIFLGVMFNITIYRLGRAERREKALLQRLSQCHCAATTSTQPPRATRRGGPIHEVLAG